MRKDIYLSLNEFVDRPVVKLPEHKGLKALLDTGARFPVWTASTALLKAHGGKLFKKNVSYSGIGGETIGDIYRIPGLIIGKGTNSLIFPELPVVTNTEFAEAAFELILSATMFHDIDYTVSNKRHSLIIHLEDNDSDVRNAILKLDNDFQVLFTGSEREITHIP